jgi:hypothetical protein
VDHSGYTPDDGGQDGVPGLHHLQGAGGGQGLQGQLDVVTAQLQSLVVACQSQEAEMEAFKRWKWEREESVFSADQFYSIVDQCQELRSDVRWQQKQLVLDKIMGRTNKRNMEAVLVDI